MRNLVLIALAEAIGTLFRFYIFLILVYLVLFYNGYKVVKF